MAWKMLIFSYLRGGIMKRLFLLAVFVLFSANIFASVQSGANVGSSATGPLVECSLPNGETKYIPILICKHMDGNVN